MNFSFLVKLRLSFQLSARLGPKGRKLKPCPYCKMPGWLYTQLKHTIHFRMYETWVNRKDPRVASWCEFDTRRSYQLWAHPAIPGVRIPSRLSPPLPQGVTVTRGRPQTVIDAVPRRTSAWIGPKRSRRSPEADPWTEDDVPF